MSRLDAFLVKESNGRSYWSKIGAAFSHRNGNGYNVILDCIPAPVDGSYKFVLIEPKENDNSGNSGNSYGGNSYSGNSGSGRPQKNDDDDSIPF